MGAGMTAMFEVWVCFAGEKTPFVCCMLAWKEKGVLPLGCSRFVALSFLSRLF
jgi:hypothetical protein